MRKLISSLLLFACMGMARADTGSAPVNIVKVGVSTTTPSVNVDGGISVHLVNGGSGGTASNFGAAFPTAGTAVGFKDPSNNMAAGNLDASGNLKVSGSFSATQGPTTILVGVSTTTVGYGVGLASVPVNVLNTLTVNTHAVTQSGAFTITQSTVGVVQAGGAFNVVSTNTVLGTGANAIGSITNTGFNVNNAPTVVQSTSAVNGSTIAVVNAVGTSLKVDGSAVTQPVSGTVSLTGVSTITFSGIQFTLPGIASQSSGTITTAASIVQVVISSYSNVTFAITPGTSTGVSVVFEASFDTALSTWTPIQVDISSSFNAVTTYTLDTTTQTFQVAVAGLTGFRVRATAWTNGIATVYLTPSGASTVPLVTVGQINPNNLRMTANIDSTNNKVTVIQSTVGVVTTGIALQVVSTQTFTTQPVGITTVTYNGIGQPVTSTSTFITNIPTVTFNGVGQPVTSTSTFITNIPTVTFNGVGQPVTSTSTFITNIPTVTFNGIGQPVTSTSTIVFGNVSTNTVVTNNKPVIVGGVSYNLVPPTTTVNASAVNAYYAPDGGQIVNLDCSRQNIVKSSITISASTSETVILSSGATGVYNDLISMVMENTSATAARIDFRSGGNGTNIDFAVYIPAGDTRPAPLSGHRWPQTLTAANWTAQSSASVTDIRIYGLYCKTQ